MTTFDDDFYRDILEGIAVHADNAFYRDVLDTITRYQAPEVGVALNKNQMASKQWLAGTCRAMAGTSCVVGHVVTCCRQRRKTR